MNVPTLADARAHLNITGDRDNVEIADQLATAVAKVEEHVGPLTPRTFVESQRHPGGPVLLLGRMPVLSLTEVVELVDGGLGATYPVGSFVLQGERGLATYLGASPPRAGWLRVTYSAGRAVGELPADLRQAVLELLRHLWETQRGGMQPRGGGDPMGGMGARGFTMPNRVAQLLEGHERMGGALA